MPSPTIKTELSMPDPNAAPLNLVQLFQLLNIHLSSEFRDVYQPYILQNGQPGVDDQDKVWFEKDTQGRPVAIKIFFNGHWRRVYNGMLNEIRGYSGNPGTDFDSTGWGKVEGEFDGWHLCNGNDGAPDLSDQFLIGAHMNNEGHSGYVDNEWVSWIGGDTGMHVGGKKDVTLAENNMFLPSGDIGTTKVGRYLPFSGAMLDPAGTIWGQTSVSDNAKNIDLHVQSDGSLTPDPVPIIPPFIALGWVIFLGYRT